MHLTSAVMGLNLGASGTGPFQAAGVTAARLFLWLMALQCSMVVVLGKSFQERGENEKKDRIAFTSTEQLDLF